MKYIYIYLFLFLITNSYKGYSQGSTCANATPFCTAVGTPFTYANSTTGSYGSVGCLTTTPGPNWFFIKTTTPGTYVFNIQQSTSPGGSPDIDVDFIAWGPYTSPQCSFASGGGGLASDCSSLGAPYGSVEDCSYCWDPTETMTLRPTANCQLYMILVTNYSGTSGYITFTQTSGPPTDCNITSAAWTVPASFCIYDTPIDLNLLLNGGSPGGTWSGTGVTGSIFDPADAGPGTHSVTYTVQSGLCPLSVTHDIEVNSVATPSFTQLGPYCLGETPDILSRVSLNNILGTWNPSVISTATTGTTDYTFSPQANQCAMQATMSVTVISSITPTFNPMGPYCIGATPDGLPGVSANGVAGSWNPLVISTAAAGTSIYTFTPSSSFCATPATLSVSVGPVVIPDFPPIPEFCAGTTPPVLGTTSPNGITGTWSPSVIDNNNSGSYTFTPAPNVCSAPVTMNVIVNPSPTVTVIANPSTICEDSSTTLAASGATSYIWNNGLGGGSVVTASPLSNTFYIVIGTENGCSDTASVRVTVTPLLHFSIIPDDADCGLRNGSATVNLPAGGYSYTWNTVPVQTNQTASNLFPGTYTVTVINNGCPETGLVTIIFDNIPEASFFADPTRIVAGEELVSFSDRSSGNIYQSTWYFGDSSSATGLSAVHGYADTGTYLVTHIITDNGGCSDTAYVYIHVISDFNFYIPNSFSPNGDPYNEVFFPKGNGIDPDSYSMAIYNRWGQLVFKTTNFGEGWNGTYNNKEGYKKALQGTYVYVIDLRDLNQTRHKYTGRVTLVK